MASASRTSLSPAEQFLCNSSQAVLVLGRLDVDSRKTVRATCQAGRLEVDKLWARFGIRAVPANDRVASRRHASITHEDVMSSVQGLIARECRPEELHLNLPGPNAEHAQTTLAILHCFANAASRPGGHPTTCLHLTAESLTEEVARALAVAFPVLKMLHVEKSTSEKPGAAVVAASGDLSGEEEDEEEESSGSEGNQQEEQDEAQHHLPVQAHTVDWEPLHNLTTLPVWEDWVDWEPPSAPSFRAAEHAIALLLGSRHGSSGSRDGNISASDGGGSSAEGSHGALLPRLTAVVLDLEEVSGSMVTVLRGAPQLRSLDLPSCSRSCSRLTQNASKVLQLKVLTQLTSLRLGHGLEEEGALRSLLRPLTNLVRLNLGDSEEEVLPASLFSGWASRLQSLSAPRAGLDTDSLSALSSLTRLEVGALVPPGAAYWRGDEDEMVVPPATQLETIPNVSLPPRLCELLLSLPQQHPEVLAGLQAPPSLRVVELAKGGTHLALYPRRHVGMGRVGLLPSAEAALCGAVRFLAPWLPPSRHLSVRYIERQISDGDVDPALPPLLLPANGLAGPGLPNYSAWLTALAAARVRVLDLRGMSLSHQDLEGIVREMGFSLEELDLTRNCEYPMQSVQVLGGLPRLKWLGLGTSEWFGVEGTELEAVRKQAVAALYELYTEGRYKHKVVLWGWNSFYNQPNRKGKLEDWKDEEAKVLVAVKEGVEELMAAAGGECHVSIVEENACSWMRKAVPVGGRL